MIAERPVLRYHGGKWLLAPWIIRHFPDHRVYTEAFGGAASVLLQKKRSYAEIYNDLDGELVNLFQVVRDRGEELKTKLELTPFARTEYKLSFDVSDDPLEQARRTVVRSFMGFGSNALLRSIVSGFRSNSNRSGTTPAHDWRHYPEALVAVIERLRGVTIEKRNATEIILRHDSAGTLHYCDPPYVHDTRCNPGKGYNYEMTDAQHRDLAAVLHELEGMVIVSGYHSPLYDELFVDWNRVERDAHADGARDRVEVLWMNYDRPNRDLFD